MQNWGFIGNIILCILFFAKNFLCQYFFFAMNSLLAPQYSRDGFRDKYGALQGKQFWQIGSAARPVARRWSYQELVIDCIWFGSLPKGHWACFSSIEIFSHIPTDTILKTCWIYGSYQNCFGYWSTWSHPKEWVVVTQSPNFTIHTQLSLDTVSINP